MHHLVADLDLGQASRLLEHDLVNARPAFGLPARLRLEPGTSPSDGSPNIAALHAAEPASRANSPLQSLPLDLDRRDDTLANRQSPTGRSSNPHSRDTLHNGRPTGPRFPPSEAFRRRPASLDWSPDFKRYFLQKRLAPVGEESRDVRRPSTPA